MKNPGAPSVPNSADGLDLQPYEWMDRQRLDVRRAQRDDPADQIGAAVSEHLGEPSASALTDDHRAPALFRDDRVETLLKAPQQGVGAVDVGANARPGGEVVGAFEPVGHHAERSVACQEARYEQHGPAATVVQAHAPEDRVAQQSGGLEPKTSLPPIGGRALRGVEADPVKTRPVHPINGLGRGRFAWA